MYIICTLSRINKTLSSTSNLIKREYKSPDFELKTAVFKLLLIFMEILVILLISDAFKNQSGHQPFC